MSTREEDVARGRWDGAFWAERFMGVRLHPGQKAIFEAALARHQSPRWWIAAYLTICLSAGNRAGKTLIMALIIVHSCFYKVGVKPPTTDAEAARWRTTPYIWYHFAIQEEVAQLVYTEIINMLQGVHVAQHMRGCPLVDELKVEVTWDSKDLGEYAWIVFDKKWGGAEIKFRTTKGNKGKGALGQDMNGITFDECGLEPNLKWIYDNLIHLRRLGTGGQVFFFSTPEEGLTEFADFWFMGDPEQPDHKARRMSLRMSTRDNIGFGLDQEMFDALVADMDEDHVKQNIDGYFIQGRAAYFNHNSVDGAFVDGLPEVQAAQDGHMYAQGVDPAIRVDSMWSIVADVKLAAKRYDPQAKEWVRDTLLVGVRAERSKGRKTTDGIVEMAESVHFAYDNNRDMPPLHSSCTTAIDSTGFGGHMFQEQLDAKIVGGVRSIEFGGSTQKKRKLLGDLRTALDTGALKMPRSGIWLDVRRQLLGYKYDDKNIEQDAVMALACLVAVSRTLRPGGEASTPFDASLSDAPIRVLRPFFNPRKPRHHG